MCRPGQRTLYSSGRQETVKVACEVEANPSDVSFVWKFNTSLVESVDIPANLIAVDRTRSVAHFTPHTENVSKFRHYVAATKCCSCLFNLECIQVL